MQDRQGHPRTPSRGLDGDASARTGRLPLDPLLGDDARDPDLAELTEMAREGGGIAELSPELRRGLDERSLDLGGDHAPKFERRGATPPARCSPPRPVSGGAAGAAGGQPSWRDQAAGVQQL